jgi:hypothetical protein
VVVFAVVDTVMAIAPNPAQPSAVRWIEVAEEENWDQVREIFEPAAQKLRAGALFGRSSETKEIRTQDGGAQA